MDIQSEPGNCSVQQPASFDFRLRLQSGHAKVALPSSLQSLTFCYSFNQSLEEVGLLNSLQSLTLGDGFTQSLAMALPSSLLALTISYSFNQSMGSCSALQPAVFDPWLRLQSEPRKSGFAQQPAVFDLRREFGQSLG